MGKSEKTSIRNLLLKYVFLYPVYYFIVLLVAFVLLSKFRGNDFAALNYSWALPRLLFLLIISAVVSYAGSYREIFALAKKLFQVKSS